MKTVIIINGKGGVGKDTLIKAVTQHYSVLNASAITPIKNAAKMLGWDNGKDVRSRKFLSDLKQLSIKYNEYPTQHLLTRCGTFYAGHYDVMFVHIREPEEIDKFKALVACRVVTLLVRRDLDIDTFGNKSDDDVENYKYDYVFDNNKDIETAKAEFVKLIDSIIGGKK